MEPEAAEIQALSELAQRRGLMLRKHIVSAAGHAFQFILRVDDSYEKWMTSHFQPTFDDLAAMSRRILEDETMANIFKVGDLFEYLSAEMFPPGRAVNMTIKRVDVKEVHNQRGEQERAVLYFEETDKGLVVGNKTNVRQLVKLLGTPETEEWIGRRITLYSTDVTAFGKTMRAIRIADKLPKAEPKKQDHALSGSEGTAKSNGQPPADTPAPATVGSIVAHWHRESGIPGKDILDHINAEFPGRPEGAEWTPASEIPAEVATAINDWLGAEYADRTEEGQAELFDDVAF